MNTVTATITGRGQVTVPASIRRRLNIHPSDKLVFVVAEDGRIYIERGEHSLDSVLMAVPALDRDLSTREMIDIATADEAEREDQHGR
jgi:AbrB family looped-hinge helix DNA binding protein